MNKWNYRTLWYQRNGLCMYLFNMFTLQQILLPSSTSRTGAMAITSAINQQNNTQIYMDENVPMVEDNR